MRRVLHVPAMDLRRGDLVSFSDSTRREIKTAQTRVVESRLCEDHDGTWYLGFEDDDFNQFADCCEQFVLLLDL